MANATVTVKLADLSQVQRLVVAAAGVLDGVDVAWMRGHAWGVETIRRGALVDLLAALEALEAAK